MKKINNPVFVDLKKVGLIKVKRLKILQHNLRNGLSPVFKDTYHKYIFLGKYLAKENYYRQTYSKRVPQKNFGIILNKKKIISYTLNDNLRYFNFFKKYIKNKSILDYGCGYGHFLMLCRKITDNLNGVELSKNCINYIQKKTRKIKIENNLGKFNKTFDLITLFHTLHYLPNQIETLKSLKKKLNKNGKVIIEVPSSKDALIEKFELKSFKDFTFCKESLIWHTERSLLLFLKYAGFKKIRIFKIQRHNLNNHLGWILRNKPGGHEYFKSLIKDRKILISYNKFLIKNNLNDTLIAIAR